jgi:hypothetical protein
MIRFRVIIRARGPSQKIVEQVFGDTLAGAQKAGRATVAWMQDAGEIGDAYIKIRDQYRPGAPVVSVIDIEKRERGGGQ